MLYVTTRNIDTTHTAYRTLTDHHGPEGGLFVPFQMPKFDRNAISVLKENSFGQNVANILNLLFSARLDETDVDSCIGRNPTRLVPMSHRMILAETWHNPDRDFNRLVRNLSSRLQGVNDTRNVPTDWADIAIRIAILFGVFGEMMRSNLIDLSHGIDVSVAAGDFSAPMAVWYAREMGLPIGNIICGCNDNGGVWDLLHHGEMRTDGKPVDTDTPRGDVTVPYNLERLIFGTLGVYETERFLKSVASGRSYQPTDAFFEDLRRGMYAGVVSNSRMNNIIRSVYHTSAYILDPYSALAYCGLQDYRNRYSENRSALVLCEQSPIHFSEVVSQSIGITKEDLADRLARK